MKTKKMKTYGELNLRELREKADLDFAHFTYKRGMCSCCYSPKDLPKMYWKDRTILPKESYDFKEGDEGYTYLLFKNADNGSGCVTKNDYIENYTCIEWGFPMEKLDLVCSLLQEQLGGEYYVEKPNSHYKCIMIYFIEECVPRTKVRVKDLQEWLIEHEKDESLKEEVERVLKEIREHEELLKAMGETI